MTPSVPLGYNINFRTCMGKLCYILAAWMMRPPLLKPVSLLSPYPGCKNQNYFSYEKFHLISDQQQVETDNYKTHRGQYHYKAGVKRLS